jgi:hypothetical protein
MNFYAESVVLLWTTAMRFGQSGGRAQHALPTNYSALQSRHTVSRCARSHARDGASFADCPAKDRRQKSGQH